MAWVKIPAEHHPLFLAALPKDRRVSTIQMFGGIGAKVNGYMFGGLFARSVIVRLSSEDQRTALALDGAAPFDPMGNGRVMKDTILLSEDVMEDPAELRDWLARSLAFTAALPPKPAKAKASPARPAPRSGAKPKAEVKASPARSAPRSGETPKPKAKAKAKAAPARPAARSRRAGVRS